MQEEQLAAWHWSLGLTLNSTELSDTPWYLDIRAGKALGIYLSFQWYMHEAEDRAAFRNHDSETHWCACQTWFALQLGWKEIQQNKVRRVYSSCEMIVHQHRISSKWVLSKSTAALKLTPRLGWGRGGAPVSKQVTCNFLLHFTGWITCQHTILFSSVLPPPQLHNNNSEN